MGAGVGGVADGEVGVALGVSEGIMEGVGKTRTNKGGHSPVPVGS